MSNFVYTPLQSGEELVLGIVTARTSHTETHHTTEWNGQIRHSHTESGEEKRIGVTDRRLVIETDGQPDATRLIPIPQITRVEVQKEDFLGQVRLTVSTAHTIEGEALLLNIPLFPGDDEALIRTAFPQAQITVQAPHAPAPAPRKRGLLEFFGFRIS